MKEWRSKKELDDFILQENRYEEIGYVTLKTLKKWSYPLEKEWEIDDNFYIVQNGNSISFYVKWYLKNNETTIQTGVSDCRSYNINEIQFSINNKETQYRGKRYIMFD